MTVLLPFLVQVGFFISPIIYPASLVPKGFQVLYFINPMALAITGIPLVAAGHTYAAARGLDSRLACGRRAADIRLRFLPPPRRHLRGRDLSDQGPPVIEARGLSKRYRIVVSPGTGGLYDSFGGLFGRRSVADVEAETVWALRDISFDLHAGHVVGVMGRNGSAKAR